MADFAAQNFESAPATGEAGSIGAALVEAAAGAVPTFKMRGTRTSNGNVVHWIASGAEDLSGAQSPYPGDINASTVVRE